MTPKLKMLIATAVALCWLSFCIWFDREWLSQLIAYYGTVGAYMIIVGLAYAPGFMVTFILSCLIMDKRPDYSDITKLPETSIIIAAFNEETSITDTFDSIVKQAYPSKINVYLLDDGSTDDTDKMAGDWILNANYDHSKFEFFIVNLPENRGKAAALNVGLKNIKTEHFITIDADSVLYTDTLRNLMANMVGSTERTVAVAGTILARNSRENWLTRLQEFDYFLGISVIKRTQSLMGGTLVLPGAFSVYNTAAIAKIGGWVENTVGEDIVLSYGLLAEKYLIGYAENAFLFTNVPATYKQLFHQRKRWARGLVEAFKEYPKILKPNRLNFVFILNSFFGPFFDMMFAFVFIPGVIMAVAFEFYMIAGLMTLYFIPIGIMLTLVHYKKQKIIFEKYGLTVRRNWLGFLSYILLFQILIGTASIVGYISELFSKKKSWGTK